MREEKKKEKEMLHLPRACVCGLKIHKQARRLSCRCVQISLPLETGNAHTGPRAQPTRLLPAEQPCFCLPAAAAGAAVSLGKCPAGQEAELPGTSSVGVGAARPCPIVFVIHKHAVHLCGQSFLTGGTGAGFPCGMGAEEL